MAVDRGWRGVARELTARALRMSGVPSAVRRVHARGSAAVLLYHDPTPQTLAAHLEYLASRFTFTTLDVVVDAIAAGDWSPVPERALVLTIDDGHRGNHALLPVFRQFGIRPTIYLCSQVVGTHRKFWFQEPIASRQALKKVSNRERLEALRRATGFVQEREEPQAERQALSLEEIRDLAPWVDVGAHTRFHPILPRCDDAEAWEETVGSKRELEELLQRPVRHFSYPNGDYGPREVEYARRAGFASARTTDYGWASTASDPFRLAMLGIADDASVSMLAAQLAGVAGAARRWVRGLRAAGGAAAEPAQRADAR
jgi:peptidoglycan/xylan/chitin deacetylase (PgdA/CDA1 family)